MLVTTGKQHIGKSAFAGVVSSGNAVTMVGDHSGKDNKMLIHSGRVIVLDEMNALWAREATYWKTMITSTIDDWRAPYAASMTRKPRGSILYGTTNEATFLHNDDTGQRRYGVLEPSRMLDFEQLKAELGQLWAEARRLFDMGTVEYWQLSAAVREHVEARFQVEDVLMGEVANYIAGRLKTEKFGDGESVKWVIVAEVADALGLPKRGKPAQDISNKLHLLGLHKTVSKNRARWNITEEVVQNLLG